MLKAAGNLKNNKVDKEEENLRGSISGWEKTLGNANLPALQRESLEKLSGDAWCRIEEIRNQIEQLDSGEAQLQKALLMS